ncbi:OLC1v1014122C1 [Oldenlandia corymbosa var. corymbosa]|uniref:OLC1v1014122C1 n=1 Tax=Oldenlandia corymbosa var. corymbosa TaxID=529605 RepID=A0AAV1E045_OLDCO|nr:OLC1v1014122C1 [Oldenlandia corymbosa var. corymbosa]
MKLQCVCKDWRGLIRSPDFKIVHSNHPKNQDNRVILLNLVIGGTPNEPDSTIRRRPGDPCFTVFQFLSYDHNESSLRKVAPDLVSYFGQSLFIAGPCNGLLCLSHVAGVRRHCHPLSSGCECMCLWNPSTRETMTLPPRPYEYPQGFSLRFGHVGFGFDSRANAYKVLCISVPKMEITSRDEEHDWEWGLNMFDDHEVGNTYIMDHPNDHCLVDVYDLSSNSWRRVTTTDLEPVSIDNGILFRGSHHWVTYRIVSVDTAELLIAYYDMSLDVIGHMKHPGPDERDAGWFASLAMILDSPTFPMDLSDRRCALTVWVMTEYGTDSSWMKKCSVIVGEIGKVMACLNNEKLLLQSHNCSPTRKIIYSDVSSCDIRQDTWDIISQEKRYGITGYEMGAVIFKESLVPIQST